ncbi:hypothetical protein GIB67_005645 [Kingdonia uniflora]|uniref:Alpha-glucan water dikinase 2 n=1 Tax=Kingdonia uniflora TaxID=39325 RepID=A0A7J7NHR2_9MAGN|nr:hypothetical protein GIB67_005645 [Kingdonia uniflora]
MSSSKSTGILVPLIHKFDLGGGTQLQVKVSGSSKGCNAKIEFQLNNCSKPWLIHWGGLYRGQTNWVLPACRSTGTITYKQNAFQTPFMKSDDFYLITIELQDPKIDFIEFILKDEDHNRWLKLNHHNFRIEIPEDEVVASRPSVPKDIVERKAYLLWESKGRPRNSPQQQQQDYDDALRELQNKLSKGISLDDLRNSSEAASTKRAVDSKYQSTPVNSSISSVYCRRQNVAQWLHKRSGGQDKGAYLLASYLAGGDHVLVQKKFNTGNQEIVAILKTVRGEYHVLVAVSMKGAAVLHWGVSKVSAGEWLVPPPEIIPERSKMVDGACQTYFKEVIAGEQLFQLVDINLHRREFVGIQFIIWSGESWIKNNGSNFSFDLKPVIPKLGKGDGGGKGIIKWLLDEISQREKDAERSLMHRFNIATELTERCKVEGELGLIAIMVWLRFMSCRQLTWNKNYNVKPRLAFPSFRRRLASMGPIWQEIEGSYKPCSTEKDKVVWKLTTQGIFTTKSVWQATRRIWSQILHKLGYLKVIDGWDAEATWIISKATVDSSGGKILRIAFCATIYPICEISAAQDKFTDLLQKIYHNQPNDREIVRLIMQCIGRGGQGDVGQKIRDEILVLQRNNDCKGGMMEEWHQKLHNNSSPDDVIICQALLDYVKSDFRIDVYWQTLNAHGLTKNILRSYDRPILSEPHFRVNTKEGLVRDLTSYLKTLKAVHSGADLESNIETCLGYSSKGYNIMDGGQLSSVSGLTSRLQESLKFVKVHVDDKNIGPLMEKLLESRIELRPILSTSHGRLKDLIFLDIALDSAVRTTMERGFKELSNAQLPDIMLFMSLMLENLSLSTVDNEDLIYCTKDWYRVCELYRPNEEQWALHAKAVIDRVQLVLTDRSQYYQEVIQPSAQYLGGLLGVEKWTIDIFTEELIRAGSAPTLSMFVNRLDPTLRKIANLGCFLNDLQHCSKNGYNSWQIISPMEVCGFVTSVNELTTVQSKVYKKPTIIIANKVRGEEEIPDGVVAVLTPDMPDVLSHVSVRARNNKVCFATCFDRSILRDLQQKDGKAISIKLRSASLVISDISTSSLSLDPNVQFVVPRGITLKKKTFGGKYAVSVEEFTTEMIGAKSRNIQFLRGKIPAWIKIPTSVALPFGVFEAVLSADMNKS